jgi:hypothetical protein
VFSVCVYRGAVSDEQHAETLRKLDALSNKKARPAPELRPHCARCARTHAHARARRVAQTLGTLRKAGRRAIATAAHCLHCLHCTLAT